MQQFFPCVDVVATERVKLVHGDVVAAICAPNRYLAFEKIEKVAQEPFGLVETIGSMIRIEMVGESLNERFKEKEGAGKGSLTILTRASLTSIRCSTRSRAFGCEIDPCMCVFRYTLSLPLAGRLRPRCPVCDSL